MTLFKLLRGSLGRSFAKTRGCMFSSCISPFLTDTVGLHQSVLYGTLSQTLFKAGNSSGILEILLLSVYSTGQCSPCVHLLSPFHASSCPHLLAHVAGTNGETCPQATQWSLMNHISNPGLYGLIVNVLRCRLSVSSQRLEYSKSPL